MPSAREGLFATFIKKDMLLFLFNLPLILGGLLVQLPQIFAILTQGSVEGLSEATWTIQAFTAETYCAYNYLSGLPFMTWGDTFFAGCQYVVIVLLLWYYRSKQSSSTRILSSLAFLTILSITLTRSAPIWLIKLLGLVPFTVVIAKVPQIMLNYRRKSTGTLSLASAVIQAGGNFARVISSLLMVNDKLVLACHLTAFACNSIPALQILLYSKENYASYVPFRKRHLKD